MATRKPKKVQETCLCRHCGTRFEARILPDDKRPRSCGMQLCTAKESWTDEQWRLRARFAGYVDPTRERNEFDREAVARTKGMR